MGQENLDEVIDAIREFLKVNHSDPKTWYQAPLNPAETCATGLTEYADCIK